MKAIIIEDEFPAREELKYFIEKFSKIKLEKIFDDSIKALKYLEENQVEIIFMDIQMPNLDGMSLAKIISKLDKKTKIIFISAYKEYAIEAFEISAFDYILKPYSEERIISTLKKLEEFKEIEEPVTNNFKIVLWKNEKMIAVKVSDICFAEAMERETIIYTKYEIYTANSSISEFLKKLPENLFFKTHRSYIVNINKICEIIPWFNNTYNLKLEGLEKEVPVSRNNLKEFKKIMGIN